LSVRSFKRAHARRVAGERRRLISAKHRAAIAGATLTASALFAAGAQAATVNTYTVTTTGDDSGSTALCEGSSPSYTCGTLRDAIYAANSDGQNDLITFQSGLSGTITLGSTLTISDGGGLMIDGPGSGTLTVSGAGPEQHYRVFDVTSQNSYYGTTISGLTVTNGHVDGRGGAIYNEDNGRLTLTDDVISGSTATSEGGGVSSNGNTTISGTTITGNASSDSAGGGLYLESGGPFDIASAQIENSTITGNTANNNGGGIESKDVDLAITGSQITNNTTGNYGGGIDAAYSMYGLSISGSTISGNTATDGGGGLSVYNRDRGPTSPKYSPVTIDTSTISNNNAPLGAGIDLVATQQGSPVKISASTISGNQGGSNSFGGGLLLEGYAYAPVRTVDSTISGNSATNGGGVSVGYDGREPLFGYSAHGSLTFDNSTIAGNTADSTGGGIYLSQYNSTPEARSANSTSGPQPPSATLRSTIVSGNTAAGSPQDLDQADPSSGGFDGAFSLVQHPGNAAFLSQNAMLTGVDPQLGPLQNNGGPTETMLPSGTSPVIDQGHSRSDLSTDQRGDQRTVDVNGIPNAVGGDGTDIGATELPASAVVVPTPPSSGPAGFSASIRGQLIGGGGTPPLVHGATHVDCAVKTGTLSSCSVEIRSTGGRLVARGESTTTSPVKSLSTVVSLTGFGRRALYHHPLGRTENAKAFGATSASGEQAVSGKVLLLHPFVRLHISKRSTHLSKGLLRQIAKAEQIFTLADAKSATCTAYSDKGTGDKPLTQAQAKAACDALTKDGFTGPVKSVGKGQAHPIAPNNTKKGRSLNRRLVILFKF
jgi:hypothetical protein